MRFVERSQAPQVLRAGVLVETIVGDLLHFLLKVQVERCIDVIAAGVEILRAQQRDQHVINYILHKMRGLDRIRIDVGFKVELLRLLNGLLLLLSRDHMQLHHRIQHCFLPLHRCRLVENRVIIRGTLGQAGQHGGLREIELTHRWYAVVLRAFGLQTEIILGRGLRSVVQFPVVDDVQVHFHDLPLGQLLSNTIGQDGLFGFDLKRARIVQEELPLDQLLRDRARALDGLLALYIGNGRADDSLEVHPVVSPEGVVLSRNCGVNQEGRDIVVVHVGAPPVIRIVDLVKQVAIAVINARRLKHRMVSNPVQHRELRLVVGVGRAYAARKHNKDCCEDYGHTCNYAPGKLPAPAGPPVNPLMDQTAVKAAKMGAARSPGGPARGLISGDRYREMRAYPMARGRIRRLPVFR